MNLKSSGQILSLDVGTATVKAAVAQFDKDGGLTFLKIWRAPTRGLRRGMVEEPLETAQTLNQVFAETQRSFKNAVKNIYLNTGGAQAKIQPSRSIVAVSRADSEIYKDDINRAVQASRAVNLAANRMVIHSITNEFIVDGMGAIRNPLGMTGSRLEVNGLIIDAFAPAIKNLTKAVETAGGQITGFIFGPLASSRAILNKNQKELGVVLVDIGFATTGLAVYEENKLLHAAVFPVGSGNVTNDLAIGLRTSVETAELIKRSCGSALASEVPSREVIDLSQLDARAKGSVSRRYIAEIIEVRLAEILELVGGELKQLGKDRRLPAGVVLVGGGAKLPGAAELARQELKLPVQLGTPDLTAVHTAAGVSGGELEDPELACCLGLALLANDETEPLRFDWGGMNQWVRRVVNYFIP